MVFITDFYLFQIGSKLGQAVRCRRLHLPRTGQKNCFESCSSEKKQRTNEKLTNTNKHTDFIPVSHKSRNMEILYTPAATHPRAEKVNCEVLARYIGKVP